MVDAVGEYEAFGIVPTTGVDVVSLRLYSSSEANAWETHNVSVAWPSASTEEMTLDVTLTVAADPSGNPLLDRLELAGTVQNANMQESIDIEVDYEQDGIVDDVYFVNSSDSFSLLLAPGNTPQQINTRLSTFNLSDGTQEVTGWQVPNTDSYQSSDDPPPDDSDYDPEYTDQGTGTNDSYGDDSGSGDTDQLQPGFSFAFGDITQWPEIPGPYAPDVDALPATPDGLELNTEIGDGPDPIYSQTILDGLQAAQDAYVAALQNNNDAYRSAVDGFEATRDGAYDAAGAIYLAAIATSTAAFNSAIDGFSGHDLAISEAAVVAALATYNDARDAVISTASDAYQTASEATESGKVERDEQAELAFLDAVQALQDAHGETIAPLHQQQADLDEQLGDGAILQADYDSQYAAVQSQIDAAELQLAQDTSDAQETRDDALIDSDITATNQAAGNQKTFATAVANAGKSQYDLYLESVMDALIKASENQFDELLNIVATVAGQTREVADADKARQSANAEADRIYANNVAAADRNRKKDNATAAKTLSIATAGLNAQAERDAEGNDMSPAAAYRIAAIDEYEDLQTKNANEEKIRADKVADADYDLDVAINNATKAKRVSNYGATATNTKELADAAEKYKEAFLSKRKVDAADAADFSRSASIDFDSAQRGFDRDIAGVQHQRTTRTANELKDNRKAVALQQNKLDNGLIDGPAFESTTASLNAAGIAIHQTIGIETYGDPETYGTLDALPDPQESHSKLKLKESNIATARGQATSITGQASGFASANTDWGETLDNEFFDAVAKRNNTIITARLTSEGAIAGAIQTWTSKVTDAGTAFVEKTADNYAEYISDMAAAMVTFQVDVATDYSDDLTAFATANPDNPWAAQAATDAAAALARVNTVTAAYQIMVDAISTAEGNAVGDVAAAEGGFYIAETGLAVTMDSARRTAESDHKDDVKIAEEDYADGIAGLHSSHDGTVNSAQTGRHNDVGAEQDTREEKFFLAAVVDEYASLVGSGSGDGIAAAAAVAYVNAVVPRDEIYMVELAGAQESLYTGVSSKDKARTNALAGAANDLEHDLADAAKAYEEGVADELESLEKQLADIWHSVSTTTINANATFGKAVSEANRIYAHAVIDAGAAFDVAVAQRTRDAVATWAGAGSSVPLSSYQDYSLKIHDAELAWTVATTPLITTYLKAEADQTRTLVDAIINSQQGAAIAEENAYKTYSHSIAGIGHDFNDAIALATSDQRKSLAGADAAYVQDAARENDEFSASLSAAVTKHRRDAAAELSGYELALFAANQSYHSTGDDVELSAAEAAGQQSLAIGLSGLEATRASEIGDAVEIWGDGVTLAQKSNTDNKSGAVKGKIDAIRGAWLTYHADSNTAGVVLDGVSNNEAADVAIDIEAALQLYTSATGAAWTTAVAAIGTHSVTLAHDRADAEADYVVASAQDEVQQLSAQFGSNPDATETFMIRVGNARVAYLSNVHGSYVTAQTDFAQHAVNETNAATTAGVAFDDDIATAQYNFVLATQTELAIRSNNASSIAAGYSDALATAYGEHLKDDTQAHHDAVLTASIGVRAGGKAIADADAGFYSTQAGQAHTQLLESLNQTVTTPSSDSYKDTYAATVASARHASQLKRLTATNTRLTELIRANREYSYDVAEAQKTYRSGIAGEQLGLANFVATEDQTFSDDIAEAVWTYDRALADAVHATTVDNAGVVATAAAQQTLAAQSVYHTFDDVVNDDVRQIVADADGAAASTGQLSTQYIGYQTDLADANKDYAYATSDLVKTAQQDAASERKEHADSVASTRHRTEVDRSQATRISIRDLALANFDLSNGIQGADHTLKTTMLDLRRDAEVAAGFDGLVLIDAALAAVAKEQNVTSTLAAGAGYTAAATAARDLYFPEIARVNRDEGKDYVNQDHGLAIDLAGIIDTLAGGINDQQRIHRKSVIDAVSDYQINIVNANVTGLLATAATLQTTASALAASTAQSNAAADIAEINSDRTAQKGLADQQHAADAIEIQAAHDEAVTAATERRDTDLGQFDSLYAIAFAADRSALIMPSVTPPAGISWTVSAGAELSGWAGSLVEALQESLSYGQDMLVSNAPGITGQLASTAVGGGGGTAFLDGTQGASDGQGQTSNDVGGSTANGASGGAFSAVGKDDHGYYAGALHSVTRTIRTTPAGTIDAASDIQPGSYQHLMQLAGPNTSPPPLPPISSATRGGLAQTWLNYKSYFIWSSDAPPDVDGWDTALRRGKQVAHGTAAVAGSAVVVVQAAGVGGVVITKEIVLGAAATAGKEIASEGASRLTNGVTDVIDLTRTVKNVAKEGAKKLYKLRVDESLDLLDARKALDDPVHDIYGKRPIRGSAPRGVDLTDAKGRTHILDGDGPGKGGGHRFGTGKPGKSEFPASWTDEKILSEVSEIAMDSSLKWSKPDKRGYITAVKTVDGVDIKVVYDTIKARIVTGFPTNLPKNP